MTKGHPLFARPRRLAPDKLVTAQREFKEIIRLGRPYDGTKRQRVVICFTHGPKKTETGDHAATIAV